MEPGDPPRPDVPASPSPDPEFLDWRQELL